MGERLQGFDYTRPYFYMVTLRKAEGAPEFSRVVGESAKGYLEPGPLALRFRDVIKTFHETWFCIFAARGNGTRTVRNGARLWRVRRVPVPAEPASGHS